MSTKKIKIVIDVDGKKYHSEITKAAKETENLGKGAKRTQSAMQQYAGAIRLVSGAAAGYAALGFTKEIVRSGLALERINRTLGFATQDGEASFTYLTELTESFGLELLSTADAYAKLSAAAKGSELESQTQSIFRGVSTAAAALGLSVAETDGIFRALEQMISKGNVQAEELRGQLGERLPGAFQAAAKAMGVTTAELNDMLERGEVLASDLLPRLAAELEHTYADTAMQSAKQGQAAINRLTNAWTTFTSSLYNSDAFSTASNYLANFIGDIGLSIKALGGDDIAIIRNRINFLKRDIDDMVSVVDSANTDLHLGIITEEEYDGYVTKLENMRNELGMYQNALEEYAELPTQKAKLAELQSPGDKDLAKLTELQSLITKFNNTQIAQNSNNPFDNKIRKLKDNVNSIIKYAQEHNLELTEEYVQFLTQAGESYHDLEKRRIEKSHQLEKQLNQRALAEYKQMQREKLIANNDFYSGATLAMLDYEEKASNITQQYQDLFTQGMRTMEDAIVRFSMTGKLSFKDMANSIIADYIRIQARQKISGLMNLALNYVGATNRYGTNFGSEQTAMLAEQDFGLFHTGGVVGQSPTQTKSVNPWVFRGAQRYHTGGVAGLKPKEVPAILEQGELIFTEHQAKALAPVSRMPQPVVNVNIVNNSNAKVTQQSQQGENGEFDIEVLIEEVDNAIGTNIASGTGSTYNAMVTRGFGS